MHHSTLRTEREEDVLFLLIFILIIWSLSFFRSEKKADNKEGKVFRFETFITRIGTACFSFFIL